MITTVTLNASVDKAYLMEKEIVGGTVMRVQKCRNSAGGKGLNVSRVIDLCGSNVKATGLVGGYNGKYLEQLLEEDGIAHEFGHVAGETRSCINILDPKFSSTEFLEPGCTVTPEELDAFLEAFPSIIADSDVVTMSGSIPAGVPKDIYKTLTLIAKKERKTVLLDTSGEVLREGLAAKPDLIKPNKDELQDLFGREVSSLEDVLECAKELRETGIEYVVVSMGGDGSLLLCEEGVFRAVTPEIEVVNTVGCGDSMIGGFAVAFEQGKSPAEALRYASAVATANALSPNTGNFDPAVLEELHKGTQVKAL